MIVPARACISGVQMLRTATNMSIGCVRSMNAVSESAVFTNRCYSARSLLQLASILLTVTSNSRVRCSEVQMSVLTFHFDVAVPPIHLHENTHGHVLLLSLLPLLLLLCVCACALPVNSTLKKRIQNRDGSNLFLIAYRPTLHTTIPYSFGCFSTSGECITCPRRHCNHVGMCDIDFVSVVNHVRPISTLSVITTIDSGTIDQFSMKKFLLFIFLAL